MKWWGYGQLLTVDRRPVCQCERVGVWPAVDCGYKTSLPMRKVGVWPAVDCG